MCCSHGFGLGLSGPTLLHNEATDWRVALDYSTACLNMPETRRDHLEWVHMAFVRAPSARYEGVQVNPGFQLAKFGFVKQPVVVATTLQKLDPMAQHRGVFGRGGPTELTTPAKINVSLQVTCKSVPHM